MILARVDGVMTTTICHASLTGFRTVICQPLNAQGGDDGAPILAIDPLGAGEHQQVIISADGKAARECVRDPKSPLRNIVIAVAHDRGAPTPA